MYTNSYSGLSRVWIQQVTVRLMNKAIRRNFSNPLKDTNWQVNKGCNSTSISKEQQYYMAQSFPMVSQMTYKAYTRTESSSLSFLHKKNPTKTQYNHSTYVSLHQTKPQFSVLWTEKLIHFPQIFTFIGLSRPDISISGTSLYHAAAKFRSTATSRLIGCSNWTSVCNAPCS